MMPAEADGREPGAPARRLPVGAEPMAGGGVHFRVWAPNCRRVEVVIENRPGEAADRAELLAQPDGYFAASLAAAGPGTLYRFRLDDSDDLAADPASRFQPEGPFGPSQVVDPAGFPWTDAGWPGIDLATLALYEMHVGTFTAEGSWAAAARELPRLAELGITAIEIMPVADFAGRFGWGYDGVDLFAPTRLYGGPDDFRRFVDRAHAVGLGVILDVVYNHFGPAGNVLTRFSDKYLSGGTATEWGDAINFDGPGCGPVREFFLANAGYWIDEYHLDGLRLDATQSIMDRAERDEHILAAIGRRVREAAPGRKVFVVAENEPQEVRLIRPIEDGGYGLDAMWNDDLHHAARVALTGRREAYFSDYRGTPQEFVSAAKWGLLYQGQDSRWQDQPRGSPSFGLAASRFVTFLENHDQVANSAAGLRLSALAGPGRLRALTAYLLLGPGIPMLFQGQEFASSAPFTYFADHEPPLAEQIARGRVEFLGQFPSIAAPGVSAQVPDPGDPATFERCRLDLTERERHGESWALHRDLLRLRHSDGVYGDRAVAVDGAVLGPEAFALRFFAADRQDRLLLVNLGVDLPLEIAPEPLLAPPAGYAWGVQWSSEDPRYGGGGTAPVIEDGAWRLPGPAAVALRPVDSGPPDR